MRFLCILLVLAASVFALPVGDPRTLDEHTSSMINVPIQQGMHELSLHTFMGASRINYPDMGGTKFSPGFGAAFTYNYFITPRWSFLVGGGMQLFNNRAPIPEDQMTFTGVLEATDYADGGFGQHKGDDQVLAYYKFSDYEELQWSLMFMIPVMLQYQTNEVRNKAFYYAFGAKLGIPFAGVYDSKVGSASICGYYPKRWGPPEEGYNYEKCREEGYYNTPDAIRLGFGDFGNLSSYSKLKFSTAFFGAFEAGVKWRLYNKLAVYTGFWLDYAINDIAIKSVTGEDVTWEPYTIKEGYNPEDPTPSANIDFKSRARGPAIPMSLGFTVRFALGAGIRQTLDSTKWIREILYRDSLLAACKMRNDKLEDSTMHLNSKVDALLDSLASCRGACGDVVASRDELNRIADSLARAMENTNRLIALERARADSIARAEQLERDRVARLNSFRARAASVTSGLDDYGITQTVPSERARMKLDTAAALMRDYPDLKIRISGHTCDKGTYETNLRYGMQRAESARNYLVNVKGIDPSRITVRSMAEKDPIVPNISEDNRRKNRRVQLEIIEGVEKEVK